MSRAESGAWSVVLGLAGVAGGVGLAAFLLRRSPGSTLVGEDHSDAGAKDRALVIPRERPYTVLDVEAAARMLSSENPRGTERLHVEQVWSQIRSRRSRQSLFDRITAGSGWGPQGERSDTGGVRPVSTDLKTNDRFRGLVRDVLDGKKPSNLPGAKRFFEPAVQDAVLKIANEARRKRRSGLALTKRETRLLNYYKTSAQVREDWLKHSRFLDSIDGVEFYT